MGRWNGPSPSGCSFFQLWGCPASAVAVAGIRASVRRAVAGIRASVRREVADIRASVRRAVTGIRASV